MRGKLSNCLLAKKDKKNCKIETWKNWIIKKQPSLFNNKLKLLLHFPITDSIKTTKKKTVSGFAYNSQMIKFRHIQVYVIRNRIYHYFAIKINFFD